MRVDEFKRGRRQQQALVVEPSTKQLVMPTIAVGGVANHWMEDVPQVAAYLMLTAGCRLQFDE